MTIPHALLAIASGIPVGFPLGLIGGSQSTLTAPLPVYGIGVYSAR